jgi:uncharacterized membrane protein
MAQPRRRYIDWARGIAVLIMIAAHTLDAWTRAADRSSPAFGYLLLLGGFAAPLFLWLAGLGLALSADQIVSRTGRRPTATEAIVRRGAEIFILAFLFRVQAFIVSPGSSPVTLFRVDILNVMGPAIAAAGLLWGLSGGPRRAALTFTVVATAIAMITPIVRSAESVGGLPIWIQWYIRPSGDHTTFTLFPWAAFVFAGAAYGSVLALARDASVERRATAGLALAGAGVLAVGVYTASLPTIYQASSFWTSSPTYFAVRVGVIMLSLAVLFLASPAASWLPRPFALLEMFGRNSLFIYWIHVELAYGYATWIIHHRLPLAGTVGAYVLFCAAMLGAILLRDRAMAWWRAGRSHNSAPNQRVTAQA